MCAWLIRDAKLSFFQILTLEFLTQIIYSQAPNNGRRHKSDINKFQFHNVRKFRQLVKEEDRQTKKTSFNRCGIWNSLPKCQLNIKWHQRTKSLNINTLLKGITIEGDNKLEMSSWRVFIIKILED